MCLFRSLIWVHFIKQKQQQQNKKTEQNKIQNQNKHASKQTNKLTNKEKTRHLYVKLFINFWIYKKGFALFHTHEIIDGLLFIH